MGPLYFAYGSNLKLSRMRERVSSARPEGVALLVGYRLAFDKRGADGSGKANLRPDPTGRVWGALYSLDVSHWPDLDAHEPGYERVDVDVARHDTSLRVQTYRSQRFTADPVPHDWYGQLIVEGAREHVLPAEWIRTLEGWIRRS